MPPHGKILKKGPGLQASAPTLLVAWEEKEKKKKEKKKKKRKSQGMRLEGYLLRRPFKNIGRRKLVGNERKATQAFVSDFKF
jgi:hypothetical protein